MRRLLARAQGRRPFPRWPIESSLHDFYAFLFDLLADIAGARIPVIAPWPDDYGWALVLTHDVETRAAIGTSICCVTSSASLAFVRPGTSSPESIWWMTRSSVTFSTMDSRSASTVSTTTDGSLESLRTLLERLPSCRSTRRRWNAVGFRSPATHRVWEWMPLIGFDYDSSYPDTDPYEPQPGGCCSWLPYFNQDLVELPITLPQDYTLFTILATRTNGCGSRRRTSCGSAAAWRS